MSHFPDPANQELLQDFFVEADLQVDMLEQNILVLENDPRNADAIDEIFRAAHTLKGASATVQMDELTHFTHLVEDVFDSIREGKADADGRLIDTLLSSIDVIKEMLNARRGGSVYTGHVTSLTDALRSVLGDAGTDKKKTARGGQDSPSAEQKEFATPDDGSARVPSASTAAGATLSEYELLELRQAASSAGELFEVRVDFDEDNPMNTVGGIQVFAALKGIGEVLKTAPDFEALYDDVYHPTVKYWIVSNAESDAIRSKAEIADVTDSVEVASVSAEAAPTTEPRQAENVERAPTAPPTQEAETPGASQETETPNRSQETETPGASQETETPNRSQEVESSASESTAEGTKRPTSSGSILRVDSRRIDNLLNLVSETVIVKAGFNQMANDLSEDIQTLATAETEYRDSVKELFDALPEYFEQARNGTPIKDVKKSIQERFSTLYGVFDKFEGSLKSNVGKFRAGSQNLARIAGELQQGVMRIRMVPIAQIFSRFPRLVRDLSKSLDKKLNLVIEGEDTELDKSVIEDLLDPLIHCARNSLDHGIEQPADRREAGKPDEGTLKLRASNEGNMILIEVSDDGRGIDVESVRAKAIDRGVIHPSKQLSDVEAFNLIFEPGFSTARAVTDISGRGVGLDVVRKQIEKLNGHVVVWSEKGVGTKFTIKIPLTLAIIQGLLVRVGSQMYAIPITSVMDSHRIRPSEIKRIDNYEVFNVREDVVSLIRLNRLFRIDTDEDREYYFVVVVGSGDKRMGLIVDELIGEEDVVIKPLRDHYTNVPGIAGANITGDGTVSLIIDVGQLLELGLSREREQRKQRETTIR